MADRRQRQRNRDRLKLRGEAYQQIVAKLREIKRLLVLGKKRSAIYGVELGQGNHT